MPHCAAPWATKQRCSEDSVPSAAARAFDRRHRAAGALADADDARADLFAAEQHRAGAAVAGVAADLGAREAELVAQGVGEPARRVAGELVHALPLTNATRTIWDRAAGRARGRRWGRVPETLRERALQKRGASRRAGRRQSRADRRSARAGSRSAGFEQRGGDRCPVERRSKARLKRRQSPRRGPSSCRPQPARRAIAPRFVDVDDERDRRHGDRQVAPAAELGER